MRTVLSAAATAARFPCCARLWGPSARQGWSMAAAKKAPPDQLQNDLEPMLTRLKLVAIGAQLNTLPERLISLSPETIWRP